MENEENNIESLLRAMGAGLRSVDLSRGAMLETRRRVAKVISGRSVSNPFVSWWIPVCTAAAVLLAILFVDPGLRRSDDPDVRVFARSGDAALMETRIDELRSEIAGDMDEFSFRYEWIERVSVLDQRRERLRDDMDMCWLEIQNELGSR